MADKLVDMKYTKAEVKEEAKEYAGANVPEYSWGLQIRLEDEEIDKLGIKSLPEVGGEYHLSVIARVTSVSQSQMASGDDNRCICLQITMMGIDLAESADDEKGEKETPASESAETRKPAKGGVMGRS